MNFIYWLEEEREQDKKAKYWGERRWSVLLLVALPFLVILPLFLLFLVTYILEWEIAMFATFITAVVGIITFLSMLYKKVFSPSRLITKQEADVQADGEDDE